MSEIQQFTPERAAPTEIERRFNLREQYDHQKQCLIDNQLIQLMISKEFRGQYGIVDLDGVERPIPSYESVRDRLEADKETYLAKAEQGFTRLQLTPFGLSIQELATRYRELLKQKKAEGKLLSQTGESLDLDTNQPLWLWENFLEQDDPATGDGLVYGATEFSTDQHGGKTKRQILAEQTTSGDPWAGWDVDLKEVSTVIPRQGTNEMVGGRKRLEANQTPIEYLKLLQDAKRAAANPEAMRQELSTQLRDLAAVEAKLAELLGYANEDGETIYGWLTHALDELYTNNRVLDDFARSDTGAVCYLIGSFYPAARHVPFAYWDRVDQKAGVGSYGPLYQDPSYGSRTRVKVKPKL